MAAGRRSRRESGPSFKESVFDPLPTIDLIVTINTDSGAGCGEESWVILIALAHT